jgi:hypothetical protein
LAVQRGTRKRRRHDGSVAAESECARATTRRCVRTSSSIGPLLNRSDSISGATFSINAALRRPWSQTMGSAVAIHCHLVKDHGVSLALSWLAGARSQPAKVTTTELVRSRARGGTSACEAGTQGALDLVLHDGEDEKVKDKLRRQPAQCLAQASVDLCVRWVEVPILHELAVHQHLRHTRINTTRFGDGSSLSELGL